jgi:hypothetical protein
MLKLFFSMLKLFLSVADDPAVAAFDQVATKVSMLSMLMISLFLSINLIIVSSLENNNTLVGV